MRYNNSNDTVELYFDNCDEFFDFLSLSVVPEHRTWNKNISCWAILPEALDKVAMYASHIFDFIDGTSLPGSYKILVDNALCGIKSQVTDNSLEPYKTLYIQPNAPDFLIKSSYKALVKKYHPEGDTPDKDLFEKIKSAYEKITNKKP